MTDSELKKNVLIRWRYILWLFDNLESVIPAWDEIQEGTCAFCTEYALFHDEVDKCCDCPIKKFTGAAQCKNTPYYAIRDGLDAILCTRDEQERKAEIRPLLLEMIDLLENLEVKE